MISILEDNSLVLKLYVIIKRYFYYNKLIIIRPDETIFEVPGIDGEEKIQKGDVVSFSFDIRNKAMVNPQIIRVRKDLDWQDVVITHFHDLSPTSTFNIEH